jgi:Cu+-exporting ATPase
MHGAAHWLAFNALTGGNTIVIPHNVETLDAADVWATCQAEGVNILLIVGDAFGRPLLDELERADYDLSQLLMVVSGGAALSAGVKQQLLTALPSIGIMDGLGASETGQQGTQISGAGAEASTEHPAAAAVLRAARARSIRPDAVRSPTPLPGLGITAVAGSGQTLAVGSRALMLRERIGVASAETRISDLEAMGRSVLLVALGGRLIGVIGLQDGLRAGARAAVQHVLDVGIEPILLSGDARDTCEALGRALDIDHLRPEVPPSERGDEVRRLRDGGAVVAVVGRTPNDDSALGAADVSVALSVAGSGSSEWSVQLASDDVRDAAYSLRVAHQARREAQLGLLLILAPAVCAVVVAAFGFAAAALAPIATCAGTALALSRLRAER